MRSDKLESYDSGDSGLIGIIAAWIVVLVLARFVYSVLHGLNLV